MDPSSHSLVLLQQLNMQREFGYLCDCTVAIGDVYFKAHRAVLAAFSNYFKMIFIHQSSECIKIQPTDIQPDIFSYLLHVMYTGKRPKQPVDATRLENGIRFLHANLLSQPASEPIQVLTSESIHSNLYGIQISTTQKTPKETIKLRDKSSSTLRQSPPGEHPQLQLSLAIGLEGVGQDQQRPPFTGQEGAAGKTLEEIQKTTMSIKQETCESDYMKSPPQSLTSSEDTESTFSKAGNRVYSCHYCGDHFESRLSLRDHLHIHVSQSLPFGVPASILESDDLGEVRPLLENLESAENYRLGNYLLNRSEEPSQHASHQEQLQLSQLSFLSKDADPIELNCNFSFLRKRKLSCTFCGHRFLRRGQLLEHLYTHKIKPHKYNHHPKCGNPVDQPLSTYGNSLTEIIQKGPDSPADHLEFPVELEPSIQQEHVEAVLVE